MDLVSWKDIKLCIGVCNDKEQINSEFFWSFIDLLKPNSFVVSRGQSRHKASSLNHIVRSAHRMKCQKVLFLDTDQTFPFDTIPKLLSRNLPVVSGLTYLRGYPYSPIAGWKKDGKNVNSKGVGWKDGFAPLPETEDQLIDVDWASVGCLLVDMNVFNKIRFPCFKEEWDPETGDRIRGHDVIFFEAVKEAGYKIYVDMLVQCGHLHTVNVNDVFVKAYYKSNFDIVQHNIIKEATRGSAYWDERHFGDMARGVKRVHTGEWQYMADQITKGATVAEIGCGPGFLMDKLQNEKKCRCYGYDISPVVINVLKERGFDGEVADFRTFSPNGQAYDYVVVSHLLEHMEDDKGFLLRAASMLKDSTGKVIIGVPTEDIGITSEMEHCQVYTKESLAKVMGEVFKDITVNYTNRTLGVKSKSPTLVAVGSEPHGN